MSRRNQKNVEEQKSDTKTGHYNIRKLVKFKNESQKEAYDIIGEKRITFLSGPAGSAKSFLTVMYALDSLYKGEIGKIILTRPMIEAAGEKMGFLPGSLQEKVHPYLVPLLDLIGDYLSEREIQQHLAQKTIEVCPLAFMRGRNFKNSFIAADECQNINYDQIKMLLSRIGEGTKIVLTGDSSQTDLKQGCCFDYIAKGLSSLSFVGYHQFTKEHIVREPIIADILEKMETLKNGW